jgi:hypothetical protein
MRIQITNRRIDCEYFASWPRREPVGIVELWQGFWTKATAKRRCKMPVFGGLNLHYFSASVAQYAGMLNRADVPSLSTSS